MVTVGAMTLQQLATWLVTTGTYSSYAEAAAALNYVIVEGVGATSTALTVAGGPGAAVSTVGQTALQVAAQAQLAATKTAINTSGVSLLGAPGGAVKTASLLSVPLGTVAAAVAPLLGVSIGATMYQSNPQLWTKISQKLLPFCYPGTTSIPTWAEIVNDAWQASVLKHVIDALKELFDEEDIPYKDNPPGKFAESDLIQGVAFPYLTNPTTDSGATFQETGWMWNSSHYVRCVVVDEGNLSYTHDGLTVRYRVHDLIGHHINGIPDGEYAPGEVAWTAKYGTIRDVEYPDGLSTWEGDTPTEIPEVQPGAVVSTDGTGGAVCTPTVPISIPYTTPDPSTQPRPDNWPQEVPYTQPVPSPNPNQQPNPTVTDRPEVQIVPYIKTKPIPIETTDPDPDPHTQTDPDLDPSKPRPPTQIITEPPFDLGPDPIGLSPWPAMPSTPPAFPTDGSAGLITVYNPTTAQLYAFEEWLWVTLSEATIDTVWNNPFDGVIGLFELYCTPTQNGHKTIRSAFLDSGIDSATISRYTYIDCGTLGIPEYYGNYLDYSPYSRAHIYLPFIGIQELNVDDIVGHGVNVTYRIDEYNGYCIAMITVAKVTTVNGEQVQYSNTMYQFSGNCAVELPISGGNQSSILAGQMMANAYQQAYGLQAAAQLAGGAASILGGLLSLNAGSIGSGISQAIGAGATQAFGNAAALQSMLSGKSTVQKSGSFGSSHGALGIKTPFITITRPKQIQVPNYEELYGFPAHKMVTIGACQGFLRCREAHVISATASDEEKAVIEQLLKSGVYVTE